MRWCPETRAGTKKLTTAGQKRPFVPQYRGTNPDFWPQLDDKGRGLLTSPRPELLLWKLPNLYISDAIKHLKQILILLSDGADEPINVDVDIIKEALKTIYAYRTLARLFDVQKYEVAAFHSNFRQGPHASAH
ncbi:MAG: hypothetical protein QM296_01710 [Bacillota bacterium]|nr:hypothetical protein [Bacillota bacterium]